MTEKQLIILQTIVEQVKANSKFNSSRDCFQQCAPLSIEMELAEYLELDNILQYFGDVLEDIPRLAP